MEVTEEPKVELSDTTTGFLRLPAEIRLKIYGEVIRSAKIDDDVDSFWNSSQFTWNSDNSHVGPPIGQAVLQHNSLTAVGDVMPVDDAGTNQSEVDNSFTAVLNLRSVCRQITRELDHEIIQHTIARINRTICTMHKPLGYSYALQSHPSHPFWDDHPLLILDPKPTTYKAIQNLQLTTFASDIHYTGNLGNDEKSLLESLAPHTRSLTLNMAVPEHVSAVSEQHVRSVVGEGVATLILHLFSAMCNKAMEAQHRKGNPLPPGGVVEVRIVFLVGHAYKRLDLWEYFVKAGGTMGVEMELCRDGKGDIVGIVFAFVGVRKLARKGKSKRKRVLGRVKRVWKNVMVGRLRR
ncbi:hypothetical protein M3J09_012645 [Ascochyta lentis]